MLFPAGLTDFKQSQVTDKTLVVEALRCVSMCLQADDETGVTAKPSQDRLKQGLLDGRTTERPQCLGEYHTACLAKSQLHPRADHHSGSAVALQPRQLLRGSLRRGASEAGGLELCLVGSEGGVTWLDAVNLWGREYWSHLKQDARGLKGRGNSAQEPLVRLDTIGDHRRLSRGRITREGQQLLQRLQIQQACMFQEDSVTKVLPAEVGAQPLPNVAVDGSCHAAAEQLAVHQQLHCCHDLIQNGTTHLQYGRQGRV
ncbi:MAG: hypothetical protein FRX49_03928 [Trebouxia sp. A1-2]|nr:MAG: hypothetical protein FRX49_03928 [Trebouxia sp. A1-2]